MIYPLRAVPKFRHEVIAMLCAAVRRRQKSDLRFDPAPTQAPQLLSALADVPKRPDRRTLRVENDSRRHNAEARP